MLIIAHRGAHEEHHENTLASLRAAIEVDADMVEFDVRLTKDRIPVLSHNLRLYGTRKRELKLLRLYTLAELQTSTKDSEHPITTLDDALQACFGKIYMNIELKEVSAVVPTLEVIEQYARKKSDWDSLLLSSFKPLAMRAVRRRVPHAALALVHYRNPLTFIGWHKLLNFSAVGFHRLYASTIAIEVAKRLGIFTYVYTVNRKEAALIFEERGVDGIVTDYPSKMLSQLERRT